MRRWMIEDRGGAAVEASVRRVTPDFVEVDVGGESVRLAITRAGGSMAFVLPSGRVTAPVIGPSNGSGVEVMVGCRSLNVYEVGNGDGTSRSNGAGRRRIRAQMPGRVVKVLVSPGDEVRAGNGLVILEAMKMENEVKAPGAAKVKRVLVSEGDRVDAGACMVEFE